MPGRYYELNVHFGIFVGGIGNFNEIFLGNQENFRGCLDSVFFNGRDVLTQAKVSIFFKLNIRKFFIIFDEIHIMEVIVYCMGLDVHSSKNVQFDHFTIDVQKIFLFDLEP